MSQNGSMSNMAFRGMALWLNLRERLQDPRERLVDAGLDRGQVVLDFGCGIGSFSLPAAQIVGDDGTVYALDIHPLAIDAVERRATKGKLTNVKTICSDRTTGLPDNSVDTILLYDVLHSVPDRPALLQELHRVLKLDGRLSVLPDHMDKHGLLETMSAEGLFSLQTQQGKVFEFVKRVDS